MFNWEVLSLIFFSISMFVNGSLFIPQALKIIKEKRTSELSLIMFAGFCLIQISTVVHGYFQNDLALMVGVGYSLLTCGFVTILIIRYRFLHTR